MFRGRFFSFLFILLLAAGLLGLAGSSIYRAGWTQGYFVGKVSDGAAAGETVAPEAAPRDLAPHGGWGFSPLGAFFGTVFKCFLFLFLAAMFFKFIGLLMWRGGGRPGWRRRGHWHHRHRHDHWGKHEQWGKHGGGRPPWYDEEADEPMKA